MNIVLAGGYIDFYVSEKKYRSLKTQRGRHNYVYTVLDKIFKSLNKKIFEGVQIRDVSITSNHFWGIDEFCEIPDLGYTADNEVDDVEGKIALRIIHIDIVGLIIDNPYNPFLEIKSKKFLIHCSSAKVV